MARHGRGLFCPALKAGMLAGGLAGLARSCTAGRGCRLCWVLGRTRYLCRQSWGIRPDHSGMLEHIKSGWRQLSGRSMQLTPFKPCMAAEWCSNPQLTSVNGKVSFDCCRPSHLLFSCGGRDPGRHCWRTSLGTTCLPCSCCGWCIASRLARCCSSPAAPALHHAAR